MNEGKENELIRDLEVAEGKCAGVAMEGPQKNLRRNQTTSPREKTT